MSEHRSPRAPVCERPSAAYTAWRDHLTTCPRCTGFVLEGVCGKEPRLWLAVAGLPTGEAR